MSWTVVSCLHKADRWRWDSKEAVWIGTCMYCGENYVAPEMDRVWLEEAAELYAKKNPPQTPPSFPP